MQLSGNELLDVLIAAAESRSLGEAARKLGLSQPGVSVKLKRLEATAPLPLFAFEGKRKVLTHYGQELYRIALASRRGLGERIEELNRRYASAASLTLRVGCRPELFESLAPKLRFAGRIEFTSLSSAESVARVLDRSVDIGVAYGKLVPDSPEIVAKKVLESLTEFAVHEKLLPKKLSEALVRDPAFLTRTPCVIYQGGGHALTDWTRHLGIPAGSLRVAAVAEDWRVLRTLVEQGRGYSLMPGHVGSGNAPGVHTLPLQNSVLPKYVFHAIFRKDLRRIPAFRDSLEFR